MNGVSAPTHRWRHLEGKPPPTPVLLKSASTHRRNHQPHVVRWSCSGKTALFDVVCSRCVHAKTTRKHHNTIFTDLEAGEGCFSLGSIAKCLSSSNTQARRFTQP